MNKYEFRAECQYDVFRFLKASVQFTSIIIDRDYWFGDCEVALSCTQTLGQLVARANSLQDCHVIAETIELEENYTGDRKYERTGEL